MKERPPPATFVSTFSSQAKLALGKQAQPAKKGRARPTGAGEDAGPAARRKYPASVQLEQPAVRPPHSGRPSRLSGRQNGSEASSGGFDGEFRAVALLWEGSHHTLNDVNNSLRSSASG